MDQYSPIWTSRTAARTNRVGKWYEMISESGFHGTQSNQIQGSPDVNKTWLNVDPGSERNNQLLSARHSSSGAGNEDVNGASSWKNYTALHVAWLLDLDLIGSFNKWGFLILLHAPAPTSFIFCGSVALLTSLSTFTWTPESHVTLTISKAVT